MFLVNLSSPFYVRAYVLLSGYSRFYGIKDNAGMFW